MILLTLFMIIVRNELFCCEVMMKEFSYLFLLISFLCFFQFLLSYKKIIDAQWFLISTNVIIKI